jgi:hypothetical protein
VFVLSSACEPSSGPILVSFLDDDNEDVNPPTPTHLPPDDSIEIEPNTTTFQMGLFNKISSW